MKWLRRMMRRTKSQIKPDDGERHAARKAVADSAEAKNEAERRWHEVKKVTDDFAEAIERALRSTR